MHVYKPICMYVSINILLAKTLPAQLKDNQLQ